MKKLYALLFLASAMLHSKAQGSEEIKSAQPPYGFIENKGQVTDLHSKPNMAVKYFLPSSGDNVLLRATGFSYDTYTKEPKTCSPRYVRSSIDRGEEANDHNTSRRHRVTIEFFGANQNAAIIPEGQSDDHINYLWEGSEIKAYHFNKVTYKDIYPGIDVEFIAKPGERQSFEYNFIVHPGADVNQIQLRYPAADNGKLINGNLEVRLAQGNIKESIPGSHWQVMEEPLNTREAMVMGFKHNGKGKNKHKVSN